MRGSSRKKSNRKKRDKSPFNYALRLLSRKDYSTFEIKKKLEAQFTDSEVEKTIEKLVERRLLSDERYVRRIIEKYAFIKKYGYLRVQYELLHRGLSYEVFAPILESLYTEEKEKENAISISGKRPVDKLQRYLTGRGYRFSVIKEVLAELTEK